MHTIHFMKVLLTGANGYIGTRLLPVLAEKGYHIVALVRSAHRLTVPDHLKKRVTVIEGDLLKPATLSFPSDIGAAYYLVHSMGNQPQGFSTLEAASARHFNRALSHTNCRQVIYLSGLSQGESASEHMSSRHQVEDILNEGPCPATILRAGIIIGSGSASFEILRDLVEKLPIMVGPRWISSLCQPIALRDVIFYLVNVMEREECLGKNFEIGGPDVLTYLEMMLQFAHLRKLKRWIIPIPLLTPYLSSLWLFFVTSTNFSLAQALVNSLKTDAIRKNTAIDQILPHTCLTFEEAIKHTFQKIEQNSVLSSWKDAIILSKLEPRFLEYIEVPQHGCLKEVYTKTYPLPRKKILKNLWSIGGDNGWYYMNWAWRLRGWLDRMIGGVGLRRGRTHPTRLRNGDVLDFWRVLSAEPEEGRLLLYAEMRLPGEAWLEWNIQGDETSTTVTQTATFRPRGLLGRLYWYSLVPIHAFIFHGMCNHMANSTTKSPYSK